MAAPHAQIGQQLAQRLGHHGGAPILTWTDSANRLSAGSLGLVTRSGAASFGDVTYHVLGSTNPHAYRTYYSFGAARLGVRNGAGASVGSSAPLVYLAADHLGSTALALTTAGAVWGTRAYYTPWGAERGPAAGLPTDFTFTGQRASAGLKLVAMGARWLDTALGRWVSADTIVPNAANPQDLNRYTYGLNSPLRYVDPTGHLTDDQIVAFTGCSIELLKYYDYYEFLRALAPNDRITTKLRYGFDGAYDQNWSGTATIVRNGNGDYRLEFWGGENNHQRLSFDDLGFGRFANLTGDAKLERQLPTGTWQEVWNSGQYKNGWTPTRDRGSSHHVTTAPEAAAGKVAAAAVGTLVGAALAEAIPVAGLSAGAAALIKGVTGFATGFAAEEVVSRAIPEENDLTVTLYYDNGWFQQTRIRENGELESYVVFQWDEDGDGRAP